jgi:hypothetical protein
MRKMALSIFSGTVVVALGLLAMPAQALLCLQLVKACQTLITKVAEAKEHCSKAQALHEQGKHADSVIQAGKAIEEIGEAAK